jgi:hypothetical protein
MNCETRDCPTSAVAVAFWPGQRGRRFCLACATRAVEVAAAMGFTLAVEPLLATAGDDDETPPV